MTRRPLDGARRITGNAATHAEYNVEPATDYGADMSETIRAPFGGWVTRWWSNSGGYSVAITTNWVKFTVQHLSAYAGKSAGQVNEGDVIGYVGNTGSATTGPHVHCWVLLIESGQRISFEQYLVNQGWKTAALWSSVPGPYQNSSVAGGEVTPFPEPIELPKITEQEEEMLLINIADGEGRYGPKNAAHYALVAADGRRIPVSIQFASALKYAFGVKNADGTPAGSAYVLSYADWEAFIVPATSTVVATNLQPVLDAVASVPAATVTLMPKTGTINLS